MTRAYQARALHDGVKPGFRAVVDNPDGWPIAHCMALGDAEQIAAALNATPSQRLDAATVERCAQIVTDGYRCRSCNAVFVEQPSDLIGGCHPDNGCKYPNWDKLTEEQQVAAIRALATEPHQHGGKGA